MDTRAAVFLLSMVLTSSAAFAGSAAQDFGVRRYVARPELLLNNDPALCESVFADTRALFDSEQGYLDLGKVRPMLKWGPLPSEGPPMLDVHRQDLDLDGTGSQQLVLYRDVDQNWNHRNLTGWVFPSAQVFDAAKATINDEWASLSDEAYNPEKSVLGGQMYYPRGVDLGGKVVDTSSGYGDHSLFEWRGRYYFFNSNFHFELPFEQEPLKVFRLHAQGRVEEVCRVGLADTSESRAKLQRAPGVSSFLKIIRQIGTGGKECELGHTAFSHKEGASRAENNVAVRPWIAPSDYYIDINQRLLARWSQDELWNWREYQAFQLHVLGAQQGVANYLVEQFGVAPEVAKTRSVKVTQWIINGWLSSVSDSYFDDEPGNPLNQAIFHRDRAALDAAIVDGRARGAPFKEELSAALSNAVEWQFGLERLLQEGADPNSPNEFGKTPLMVAAHMNRIDSVRTLLKAGANAHLWTGRGPGCGSPSPRTALAYAAENASPVLIKVLAEADGGPATEWGDRPLTLNPRLTAEERAGGIAKLLSDTAKFRGPSFNCSGARSKTEKAICGSEVLRIFDAEMARAYEQLRREAGGALTDSQRQWLRERDRECAGENGGDFADCLAEVTRTRIRYLHNRLGEKG